MWGDLQNCLATDFPFCIQQMSRSFQLTSYSQFRGCTPEALQVAQQQLYKIRAERPFQFCGLCPSVLTDHRIDEHPPSAPNLRATQARGPKGNRQAVCISFLSARCTGWTILKYNCLQLAAHEESKSRTGALTRSSAPQYGLCHGLRNCSVSRQHVPMTVSFAVQIALS